MPRKLIFTLLASIAAHAAVAYQLIHKTEEEQHTISMGSVKAPISMTFSTVTLPEPEPQPEPKPKPKPEIEPPPEPEPEPPEPKKDTLVIPDPIPEPEPEEEVVEEEIPEPVIEQVVESALEETEVEGLSDEPVFVSEPEILNWTQPRYPRSAQRRNQQGVVMLEVTVDEDGKALTISVLESSGFDTLDRSAIAAVESWEFKPQRRNNHFVQSRVHVPVAFQLN
ncbi:energy transducer TonB [Endozoicomonas montiporae]|uniref:Protein TonB n=1 Tax=Endozoicomonas montiporae CL-33 TaxID=570277 RepID=A0A142BIP9_9GAMM|nr:energy transducer TonB [Endozoicomonas montiporae]AMO58625.1 TonB family protein [Endozoicomonas montiporae CL-33]